MTIVACSLGCTLLRLRRLDFTLSKTLGFLCFPLTKPEGPPVVLPRTPEKLVLPQFHQPSIQKVGHRPSRRPLRWVASVTRQHGLTNHGHFHVLGLHDFLGYCRQDSFLYLLVNVLLLNLVSFCISRFQLVPRFVEAYQTKENVPEREDIYLFSEMFTTVGLLWRTPLVCAER